MDSSDTKAGATKKAKALLALMKTKGWKIRVHENIGWHYSLLNGGLSVRSSVYEGKTTYSCMLGTTPGSGEGIWTDMGAGNSAGPNEAVKVTVEYARECLNEYTTVLESAEEVLASKV